MFCWEGKPVYTEHTEKLKQVTERIFYLRDILDFTAAEVAEKLDIPVALYEEYESGKKDIPISMIYAVAAVFGVDATEILTGEAPRMYDYTVTRKGQGVDIKRYEGYSFETLAHNYIGRNKEPMLVSITPSDKPVHLVSHGGQEFNYVLDGTVKVIIGKKNVVLEQGDCIYFDPRIPHGQMAVGGVARFLTIIDKDN